ncbi:MAG: hypothetical protein NPIRA02_27520 [Nitrospirales bacterium]|nr:MAG: hypothetical protein NPIRA02_27520 [Nitrospirales bacterium]
MTLVVPSGCQGFVSPLDRTVTLNRILIPISSTPDPQTAIDATSAMAQILGNPEGVFTLLHIGCEQDMPNIELPDHPGWTWKTTIKTGKVVDEVLFEDAEQSFNLIVMTTRGHQHFLEAILETTTESVMQQARCPILVLPTLSPS